MKPSLLALAISGALLVPSPRGHAELSLEGVTIAIDYGRPSLNGRAMRSLLPVSHVWRLGADEATVLETSHDLKFGDVDIPSGSYSLFLKRAGERRWELVFNAETGQWGTQHDVTLDLADVPLELSEQHEGTERLTIELHRVDATTGEIRIRWGQDVLAVGFQLD